MAFTKFDYLIDNNDSLKKEKFLKASMKDKY